MSRKGKAPITVPAGVKVNLDPKTRTISIEGPKGKLAMVHRPEVIVTWAQNENTIKVTIKPEDSEVKLVRALWGTTRARIQNMINGVTAHYVKKLEVVGVGWSAKMAGKGIEMALGYADPVKMDIPMGLTVTIEGAIITVAGSDKQMVGQFAAEVRSKRPPEPYNGKGIKYSDEVIQRKQGKVFGT